MPHAAFGSAAVVVVVTPLPPPGTVVVVEPPAIVVVVVLDEVVVERSGLSEALEPPLSQAVTVSASAAVSTAAVTGN